MVCEVGPGGPVPYSGWCLCTSNTSASHFSPHYAPSVLQFLRLPCSLPEASWACNLCSHTGPTHDLMLYRHHLETLTFWTRGLSFHFVLVLVNYVAGLALFHPVLVVPSAGSTPYLSLANLFSKSQLQCHSSEKQSELEPCVLSCPPPFLLSQSTCLAL